MEFIFVGIILIAVIGALICLGNDDRAKVMNEFCNVECKQNIQKKYKFCC